MMMPCRFHFEVYRGESAERLEGRIHRHIRAYCDDVGVAYPFAHASDRLTSGPAHLETVEVRFHARRRFQWPKQSGKDIPLPQVR